MELPAALAAPKACDRVWGEQGVLLHPDNELVRDPQRSEACVFRRDNLSLSAEYR